MLSGIGDAAELKSFGIPVVKDLPEVGKNLHDHHLMFGPHVCTFEVGFSDRKTSSSHPIAPTLVLHS